MIRFHWKWKSFIRSRFLIKLMDEAISWLVQPVTARLFCRIFRLSSIGKNLVLLLRSDNLGQNACSEGLETYLRETRIQFCVKNKQQNKKNQSKVTTITSWNRLKTWDFFNFLWTKTTRQQRPRPSGGEQKFHVSRFNSITHNETTAGFTKEMRKYKKKLAS